MKLHEIEIYDEFRRMKVESGYLYNHWNVRTDCWYPNWVFVPNSNTYIKQLEHYRDTTVGLWATDRPDLINDTNNLLFEIKDIDVTNT